MLWSHGRQIQLHYGLLKICIFILNYTTDCVRPLVHRGGVAAISLRFAVNTSSFVLHVGIKICNYYSLVLSSSLVF
jgi:hypothetical protein